MTVRKLLSILLIAFSSLIATAAASPQASTAQPLTFDLLCNGSAVCVIKNASLSYLNGNVIWFYQRPPNVSGVAFSSLISLELPGGSSRGCAFYGPNGGTFSLGRNDDGSLARFMAYGTLLRSIPGPIVGNFLLHADGTYVFN
jgi:hypothetical protein